MPAPLRLASATRPCLACGERVARSVFDAPVATHGPPREELPERQDIPSVPADPPHCQASNSLDTACVSREICSAFHWLRRVSEALTLLRPESGVSLSLFRAMKAAEDGFPLCEDSARTLGVRVPKDIARDSNGISIPGPAACP
jgi:hypothetical protein